MLLLGYLIGVSWNVRRILLDWRRVQRLRRSCSPLDDVTVQTLCEDLCRRLQVRRAPRLLLAKTGHPLLMGLLCPAIVLPAPLLASSSEAELRLMLAHEVAHLRRRDLAWNILLVSIGALFFFHPLVWLARREWHVAQEMACDELALTATGEPVTTYAQMLLRVATCESFPTVSAAVGVVDGHQTLKQRLLAMRDRGITPPRKMRMIVALLLCGAVAGLVPWRVVAREEVANTPEDSTTRAATSGAGIDESATAARRRSVAGRVTAVGGAPVKAAKVYLMKPYRNGDDPLAIVETDADGKFHLPGPRPPREGVNELWGQLVVDAGDRGLAIRHLISVGDIADLGVQLPALATLQVTFQDPQSRPLPDLRVRLVRLGSNPSYWFSLPRAVLRRFVTRTDRGGRCTFAGLPRGMIVELEPEPQRVRDFASLSLDDYIPLRRATERRTIRLGEPAALSGRVVISSTGAPVAGVNVVARRITAAGSRGEQTGRERSMRTTLTDRQGRYRMIRLIPGNYILWIQPNERLRAQWTSINSRVTLGEGRTSTEDIKLIKGAIIEGRVTSAATGRPVAGQYLGLFDAAEDYQYAISKADGSFRFRAPGGKQHLWVHANAISPPRGYRLPEHKEFDFTVRNNETYRVNIQLPPAAPARAITGRVVGSDGQPVPQAGINIEGFGGLGLRDHYPRVGIYADENGRFIVEPKIAARPVRLFARRGTRATPSGTVALPGDKIVLRLQEGVLATIAGRVVDDRHAQSVSGARVRLLGFSGNLGGDQAQPVTTGTGGSFRFTNLRPDRRYVVEVNAGSYVSERFDIEPLQPGATVEQTVKLRRADSFVAGRVVHPDGKPAAGLRVGAYGKTVITDDAGQFRLQGVIPGQIVLTVARTGSRRPTHVWAPYEVTAGRADIRLVLSPDKLQLPPAHRPHAKPPSLAGRPAPEITASAWVNSRPLSLRDLKGKIVLLDFWSGQFMPAVMAARPEIQEIATQLAPRAVAVIGIHHAPVPPAALGAGFNSSRGPEPPSQAARWAFDETKLRDLARRLHLTYPLTLDAPGNPSSGESNNLGGVTARRYGAGGRSKIVIDRRGRIAYAGQSLSEAMESISRLLLS